jgi:hypothetical protein
VRQIQAALRDPYSASMSLGTVISLRWKAGKSGGEGVDDAKEK